MPKQQMVPLEFPLAGLVRSSAHNDQPIGTTFDCLNVRPYDQFEERKRGGQRTGLADYLGSAVNGTNPIQSMGRVTEALDPTSVVSDTVLFNDTFEQTSQYLHFDPNWRTFYPSGAASTLTYVMDENEYGPSETPTGSNGYHKVDTSNAWVTAPPDVAVSILTPDPDPGSRARIARAPGRVPGAGRRRS